MRKKILHTILVAVFCLPVKMLALTPQQIDDYKLRLKMLDRNARRAAILEIAATLEKSPESLSSDLVAMITNSMRDPDRDVRFGAVTAMYIVASQLAPAYLPLKPSIFDYRDFPPLKEALERAIFDPDEEISRNALGAYTFSYNLSPELQRRLIKSFHSGNRQKQSEIVEMFSMSLNPSPETQAFMAQLLDNPTYSPLVVTSYSKLQPPWNIPPPPEAALPKFVDLLVNAKDSATRQTLARIMGYYGAKAKPYLKKIEELEQKETDPTTRLNLHQAAETIRAPK